MRTQYKVLQSHPPNYQHRFTGPGIVKVTLTAEFVEVVDTHGEQLTDSAPPEPRRACHG